MDKFLSTIFRRFFDPTLGWVITLHHRLPLAGFIYTN